MNNDENISKTLNDLARARFEEALLKDILVDLTICEIENWDKREYIQQLKELINTLGEKK